MGRRIRRMRRRERSRERGRNGKNFGEGKEKAGGSKGTGRTINGYI
jgi:hypothetical protein